MILPAIWSSASRPRRKTLAILEAVEAWPDRFAELGLCISTGPVVLFRTREFLLATLDGEESAPLLEPHNVKAFETTWPVKSGVSRRRSGSAGNRSSICADAKLRAACGVSVRRKSGDA